MLVLIRRALKEALEIPTNCYCQTFFLTKIRKISMSTAKLAQRVVMVKGLHFSHNLVPKKNLSRIVKLYEKKIRKMKIRNKKKISLICHFLKFTAITLCKLDKNLADLTLT